MAVASSINIKKNSSSLKHNDRSGREPKYLLPSEFRKENEFDRTADEAQKLLDEYISEAKSNYTKITGQKFQAKVLKFEAVVNLNENHTMEDMKKLNLAIEKEFGFRAVQTAIHRDEGHIDKDTNLPVYNYHCHIVFCNLDKNGKTLLKQLNRSGLRELQTLTAEVLQMQRGESVEKTKRKHKSHQQFKKEKIEEELIQAVKKEKEVKQKLAKLRDLQELNKKLREELKQAAATREDYAKLEQLNRELKEQIKAKDLTIDELNLKIDEYKQNKAPRTNENNLNDKSIVEDEKIILNSFKIDLKAIIEKEIDVVDVKTGFMKTEEKIVLNNPNSLFKGINNIFKSKISNLLEIVKQNVNEIINLKLTNQKIKEAAKKIIDEYNQKNEKLTKQVVQLTKKVFELETELKAKNTKQIQQKQYEPLVELIDDEPRIVAENEDLKNIKEAVKTENFFVFGNIDKIFSDYMFKNQTYFEDYEDEPNINTKKTETNQSIDEDYSIRRNR